MCVAAVLGRGILLRSWAREVMSLSRLIPEAVPEGRVLYCPWRDWLGDWVTVSVGWWLWRGDLGLTFTPEGVPDGRTLYSALSSLRLEWLAMAEACSTGRAVDGVECGLIPEAVPDESVL
jgi:hypothetical protein